MLPTPVTATADGDGGKDVQSLLYHPSYSSPNVIEYNIPAQVKHDTDAFASRPRVANSPPSGAMRGSGHGTNNYHEQDGGRQNYHQDVGLLSPVYSEGSIDGSFSTFQHGFRPVSRENYGPRIMRVNNNVQLVGEGTKGFFFWRAGERWSSSVSSASSSSVPSA